MEVILEGMLERCENSTRNSWKKNYFVFKRDFSTGIFILEYYKDDNWKKQTVSDVYKLYPEFSVLKIELKNHFAFELTIGEQVHIFSANTENLRKQWVDILLEAAGVKVFNVKLIESPPAAYKMLKSFQGVIELHVTKTFIMLLANDLSKITWRFATIRRYKTNSFVFTLEVGRKSDTGEGVFRFECSNSVELFDVLDKYVKDRIKTKASMNSPNIQQVHDNPTYSHLNKTESDNDNDTITPNNTLDNSYDVLFNTKKSPQFHQTSTPSCESHQSLSSGCLSLNTQNVQEDQYEVMFSNSNCLPNNTKIMHIASSPLKPALASDEYSSVYNVCDKEVTKCSLNTNEIEEQKYVNISVVNKINKSALNKNELNDNIKKPLGHPINLSSSVDHFNSTLISSSQTSQAAEEEQYEDMSAVNSLPNKTSFIELSNRPVPAPRVKKPSAFNKNAPLSQIDSINTQEYNHLHSNNPEVKSKVTSLDGLTKSKIHYNNPSASFLSQQIHSELQLKLNHSLNLIGSEILTQSSNSLDQDYIEIPKSYSDKHLKNKK
ncbi:uncharacterized protein LOC136083619 [Hydra vulgaris]|uniref:Uncharacterized protein LOC136083619 n=1 Tax=Hydra vulgaris TaxID=6087 RepID=A0ABM4CBU1_HYDVU